MMPGAAAIPIEARNDKRDASGNADNKRRLTGIAARSKCKSERDGAGRAKQPCDGGTVIVPPRAEAFRIRPVEIAHFGNVGVPESGVKPKGLNGVEVTAKVVPHNDTRRLKPRRAARWPHLARLCADPPVRHPRASRKCALLAAASIDYNGFCIGLLGAAFNLFRSLCDRSCAVGRTASRSRRGKAGLVIALVAIAPAMAKPIAHHAAFLKALRKPPAASVPWARSIRHHVRGSVRLQEVPGGLTGKVESGGCVTPVTDVAAECPIVSRPLASFFRSVQNA